MALRLQEDKNGFQIFWGENLILSHYPSRPAIMLGSGKDVSTSHSGFFNIKEKNTKLYPCSNWSLESVTKNEIRIVFDNQISTSFMLENGKKLVVKNTPLGTRYNRYKLFLEGPGHDAVFGGGEQFTHLDLKGKKVPVWVSEPGVGRRFDLLSIVFALRTRHIPRWYNTYISMPTWISSSGRYFHSYSSAYSILDFSQGNRYGLYVWEIPEKMVIGVEETLPDAVGALSALLGRQPEPPEWIYDGLILGTQGGQDLVEKRVKKIEEHAIPLSGVWCQDWEGIRKTAFGKQLRWAWESDETLYPRLPEFIQSLKDKGIKFLAYNNTFLTPGSTMFDEAMEKGYLVKKGNGEVYVVYVPFDPAGLVDFTNPEAVAWLKEIIIKNMLQKGISGWMADMGEMIPHDSVLSSGESGSTYHNRYPVDWAKLNYEAVKEAGLEKEILTFYRAGFSGAARYSPMYWNGDQMVDWTKEDGLPSAITASLSLGMSGIGYIHSDLGGYTTLGYKQRTAELLMRWAEFAAFSQMMRSHEGNRPDRNVQISDNDQVLAHLARMVAIYRILKPYHREVSLEYQRNGYPSLRMTAFHYPQEVLLQKKWHFQYLYGRDLLVAPVVKPRKRKWRVHLPQDTWIHLWTGKRYVGEMIVTVSSPMGNPPVFYREGTKWKNLFEELKSV